MIVHSTCTETLDLYCQHLSPGSVRHEKFRRTHLKRNTCSTPLHSCECPVSVSFPNELRLKASALCNLPKLQTASQSASVFIGLPKTSKGLTDAIPRI